MIFNIDVASSVPIYAQIIAQVKHAIAAGVLRTGDSLPSLRETATKLRVNPLTVAKAYRELEMNGVVITEHGRGTFVGDNSPNLGEEYRQEALNQAVDRMVVEASQLGASSDVVLFTVRERLKTIFKDGEPRRNSK